MFCYCVLFVVFSWLSLFCFCFSVLLFSFLFSSFLLLVFRVVVFHGLSVCFFIVFLLSWRVVFWLCYYISISQGIQKRMVIEMAGLSVKFDTRMNNGHEVITLYYRVNGHLCGCKCFTETYNSRTGESCSAVLNMMWFVHYLMGCVVKGTGCCYREHCGGGV